MAPKRNAGESANDVTLGVAGQGLLARSCIASTVTLAVGLGAWRDASEALAGITRRVDDAGRLERGGE